jgi:hypothetical protein
MCTHQMGTHLSINNFYKLGKNAFAWHFVLNEFKSIKNKFKIFNFLDLIYITCLKLRNHYFTHNLKQNRYEKQNPNSFNKFPTLSL